MCLPLGISPVSCVAFLQYAEHILDCVFDTHGDMLCIPRQLGNVLRISVNEAISYFDDLLLVVVARA